MSVTDNGLVRHEPTFLPAVISGSYAEMLGELVAADTQFKTNLPLSEEWAKSWMLKCGGDPDHRLEQLRDKEFLTAYYHAKVVPVSLGDQGEIVPRIRVTLFNPEGDTLAWTSAITTSKFQEVLGAAGLGPWEPPLKLKVVGKSGKKQGFWYYFMLPLTKRPATEKGDK